MKTAFLFDLDGTITKNELLPIIGREVGLAQEIEVLTKATVSGHLPFESSFKLRVKLLGDADIEKVSNRLSLEPLYEEVHSFILKFSQDSYVVTGNLDVWIEKLANKIGCTYFCSKAEVKDNKVIGIKHQLNKGTVPDLLRAKGYSRIVSVGEGMNDLPMFSRSDVTIAFGASHAPATTLLESAHYVSYQERSLCHILNMLSS